MSEKTNATRLLDVKGIDYDIISFDVDEEDLSAAHIAKELGLNLVQIFKTLVLINNENQNLVAVIPSNYHLDLKKLAKVSHSKKCEMIHMKDLLKTTGYIRGGCSPIGMKKHFPTFIEESVQLFDKVCVSAGKRGRLMKLNPEDLIEAAEANLADLLES